jgi:3-deoxy-manno-octulosonate cytidylyltransferase (CMP-KDO synthetase)
MVMHVAKRAAEARLVSRVIVATDDQRVVDAAHAFGVEARMTSPTARSGTDRVSEVAQSLDSAIVVNIQGDEPLIEPSTIDAAIRPLLEDPQTHVSTTSEPIASLEDVFNPNVVKVVCDARGFASYFSRSPIPYIRPPAGFTLEEHLRAKPQLLPNYRKHSGIYAYRKQFLKAFAEMENSPLELLEALEQLRALEFGYRIRVVRVDHCSIGVDTTQDYERVKKIIEDGSA